MSTERHLLLAEHPGRWQYLDQVNQSSSGLKCNDADSLNALINDLTYITVSCAKFVDNRLYAGQTQLQNIRNVATQAQGERDSLLKLLAAATGDGTPVTIAGGEQQLSVNGTLFPYAEGLLDNLQFAMDHFAISWKTQIAGGSNRLHSDLKDLSDC
ncbi:MAG TPA: hypothetical protein VI455_14285 [Terriglobia bacterium]